MELSANTEKPTRTQFLQNCYLLYTVGSAASEPDLGLHIPFASSLEINTTLLQQQRHPQESTWGLLSGSFREGRYSQGFRELLSPQTSCSVLSACVTQQCYLREIFTGHRINRSSGLYVRAPTASIHGRRRQGPGTMTCREPTGCSIQVRSGTCMFFRPSSNYYMGFQLQPRYAFKQEKLQSTA